MTAEYSSNSLTPTLDRIYVHAYNGTDEELCEGDNIVNLYIRTNLKIQIYMSLVVIYILGAVYYAYLVLTKIQHRFGNPSW